MRELKRPLNFVDKLLRFLETAQNNCRTRRTYMRDKDSGNKDEERERDRERKREKQSANS